MPRVKSSDTITLVLTNRQYSLVRVACLQRLDRLKKIMDNFEVVTPDDKGCLAGWERSYRETREMLLRNSTLCPYRVSKEQENYGGAKPLMANEEG